MEFKSFNNNTFSSTKYYKGLPAEEKENFDLLSKVFHFKINNFVAENLIDWNKAPEDPIYRMVFPRKEMLNDQDYGYLRAIENYGISPKLKRRFLEKLKQKMSPKLVSTEASTPKEGGVQLEGMYNTFRTDLSLFPAPMSITCHSYCNYCFRWIMFNNRELQKSTTYQDPDFPISWLRANPQVSDVLFTGADPLTVSANKLRQYVEPILRVESVKTISITTKSLAWWPYRFTKNRDSDDLLQLFDDILASGKLINIPAHFTHPRELMHPEVAKAVARIRGTGAVIRTQGPLIQDVNDTHKAWSELWNSQVKLGMIPYYMFIEANHHPSQCFRIPIARSLEIFKTALANASTLARSVRGPVFMYDLNRTLLDGVTTMGGQKYFILKTLQAPPGSRTESEIQLLPYDEHATDLGNLYELFKSTVVVT